MHPDKERHWSLKFVEERLEAAKALVLSTAESLQASCPHALVYHVVDRNHRHDRRICPKCGLEERGSHWSSMGHWRPFDYGKPSLGNSDDRILVEISWDEFYKHRVPGQSVL